MTSKSGKSGKAGRQLTAIHEHTVSIYLFALFPNLSEGSSSSVALGSHSGSVFSREYVSGSIGPLQQCRLGLTQQENLVLPVTKVRRVPSKTAPLAPVWKRHADLAAVLYLVILSQDLKPSFLSSHHPSPFSTV